MQFEGALVAANWRWVFLVNVPIAAAAMLASLRVLPRADNSKKRASANTGDAVRPDTVGAALFTIAIGVAILVTVLGHPSGAAALAAFQHATVVIAAIAVTAGLVSLLLVRSARTRASAAVTIAENPVAAAAEEPVRLES